MTDEEVVPLIRLAESYADVADVTIHEPREKERDKWLEQRRKGIGGSDAAAIVGMDPYRTAYDVYVSKVIGGEDSDSLHAKRGRKLEDLAADEYTERHPEDTLTKPSAIFRHAVHGWMLANPDRVITSPRHKGKGIMEIKCPSRIMYEKMKLNGIPAHYMIQMQHYLYVTGYKWGVFAIFNADAWELMTVEVSMWNEQALDILVNMERDFWESNVVKQVPPSTPPRVELPPIDGMVKDRRSDARFTKAVEAYESAREYAKEANELQEAAKAQVIEAINMEPGVFEDAGHRVYYSTVAGRKTLDKVALRKVLATHGYKIDDFEKQGNDFMTLRVYPLRENE